MLDIWFQECWDPKPAIESKIGCDRNMLEWNWDDAAPQSKQSEPESHHFCKYIGVVGGHSNTGNTCH